MSAGRARPADGAKLAVRDLRVSFGPRVVVDLSSLELGRGEVLGLAGESGSGKSMTATAIAGLAETVGARVSGSILLDGEDLRSLSEADLRAVRGRRIAMIFQSPISAMNPVFRVGDVFSRALRLHGASREEARDRAERAMAEVLLAAELLERYPHELSGGQAQRVAIGLALALRSEVVLADEPTSALDVTVQAEILELLRRLRREHEMSVLFISHDLAVMSELCDRVAVMRAGRLVEAGATEEILASPREEYTRELLAAVPEIRAR